MIETNLAIDISNLQSDICGGDVGRQQLLERLAEIKNKSLGINVSGSPEKTSAESIVDGYQEDAIEQLRELSALASSAINGNGIPPMKLVHLSCCAELFTAAVLRFFRARNNATARDMLDSLGEINMLDSSGEKNHG